MKIPLAGKFKLVAVNAETGEQRVLADWFDNLILNAGLNRLGTGGVIGFCHVGSGSTAPAVTDTSLQSVVATTSNSTSDVRNVQQTAPYYGYHRRNFRFGMGAAAGNLSEVGVGWASTSSALFSRALIKDTNGDPTTITVLSNEYLDVTYELRIYPPTSDSSFTTVVAGVTHNCVLRACGVTGYYNWVPFIAESGAAFISGSGSPAAYAYEGTISTIDAQPSGTNSGCDSATTNAYSNNSYTATGTVNFSLEQANFTNKINALEFRSRMGTYQVSFNPAINKDNTKTLALNLSVTWARKTI